MGTIVSAKDFDYKSQEGLLKPIFFCNGSEPSDISFESINLDLASRLINIRPNRRTMKLEACFAEVLESFPDNAVIKDFDVMFNPDYKIDVLKILVAACKKKPFSVVWPGRYEDGKLFYAEDGYPDFNSFSVENYDVTCIV